MVILIRQVRRVMLIRQVIRVMGRVHGIFVVWTNHWCKRDESMNLFAHDAAAPD